MMDKKTRKIVISVFLLILLLVGIILEKQTSNQTMQESVNNDLVAEDVKTSNIIKDEQAISLEPIEDDISNDCIQTEVEVYITKTGTKYHAFQCGYLKMSCFKITLTGAIKKGYSPCSRCTPPQKN
ncbi:MAG: hypothetical protein IKL80_02075 [Clostridia bacterium]|nr:hypothetical protein [Clostridia bacterium]